MVGLMAAQPPSVLASWIPEGRKSCLRLFQFRGGRGNSRDRRWTCKGPGGTEASRTPVLILRSIFFSTYEILYFSFLEVSLGSFIYIYIYMFFFFFFSLEGRGKPLQYSCLENSMDRGAWQARNELDMTEQLSTVSPCFSSLCM